MRPLLIWTVSDFNHVLKMIALGLQSQCSILRELVQVCVECSLNVFSCLCMQDFPLSQRHTKASLATDCFVTTFSPDNPERVLFSS